MRYLLALLLVICSLPAADPPTFDIPRLDGVRIDGSADDWAERGYVVDVLTPLDPPRLPTADSDAALRLAWDERGLLGLLTVSDDVAIESAEVRTLFFGDSIELFFGNGVPETGLTQFLISPGLDPSQPKHRVWVVENHPGPARPRDHEEAIARIPGGYRLEFRLAWADVAVVPTTGAIASLQVYVGDLDEAKGQRSVLAWFPASGSHDNPRTLHRLRLADAPSPAVTSAFTMRPERARRNVISLATSAAGNGSVVTCSAAGTQLASATLRRDGRLALGELRVPIIAPELEFHIDGTLLVRKPPTEFTRAARLEALKQVELRFNPPVFAGETLPVPDFVQPSLAEDLIGIYSLKTTYYDRDFAPVGAALRPGRYGAVTEILGEDGALAERRFTTLYRQAAAVSWANQADLRTILDLPPGLGIDPAIAAEQAGRLAQWGRNLLRDASARDQEAAIVFSALAEAAAGELPVRRLDPANRNEAWWFQLKKRIGLMIPYQHLVIVPSGIKEAMAKDPQARFPLILYLHGAGDRGEAFERILSVELLKSAQTKADFPFIAVAPKCHPGVRWYDLQVLDTLDTALAALPIDTDRIYLTGLSMGGAGSWRTAAAAPGRFAAVVPICGFGDPLEAMTLKDLPIWTFHGSKDDVVPIARSEELVEALRAVQARVRFTVYPEHGHGCWDQAYAEPALYAWLLSQRRGKPQQPPSSVRGRQGD